MSLAGRTAFITGGSRGIGKAIAHKLAQNGANVVIAAKTVTPHPTLPGTIYSAVEEIQKEGGNALACKLDIRNDEEIKDAMKTAAERFGGIDLLINNASAISLNSIENLRTKNLDLMLNINLRGTLLCIKNCIQYLLNSPNPHVLNLSPPLPLDINWFNNHAAYTISKVGMSQMIAGLAEDYRDKGIAFNTLWPKTVIKTAALDMLMNGDEKIYSYCRKPEIVADAAYEIVKKDSKLFTKNFCIDEDLLRESGITDFSVYNYVEKPTLMEDLFIGDPSRQINFSSSYVDILFGKLNKTLLELKGINVKFSINITDLNQIWTVDFSVDSPEFIQTNESCGTMLIGSSEIFGKILSGRVDLSMAYSTGNLKYDGDHSMSKSIIQLMNRLKDMIK